MTFNSAIFVLFAAVFFAFWPLARRTDRTRYVYIIVLSLFFYGWWDWRFVPLLVGTGLVDFYAALLMSRFPAHRRTFLIASLISNLGVLGFFKYANFFASNLNGLASLFGFEGHAAPALSIVLPVGISFYTFASMSYTIDVYKRHMKASEDVWHFLAFLSLFCHLVAGPIVRAYTLMPQMTQVRRPDEAMRWEGTKLVIFGFFKKVVIADNLALTVNTAFAGDSTGGAIFWWTIVTMFAFQIYCDFSGYSDIARGLAKWMGYDFLLNFNFPYSSIGIRDFWARWHISLSTWFRDYVYIPLGGSRRGFWSGIRNMWITMLLSGLWHGANWTFLAWGAVHAAYLMIERLTLWPEKLQASGRAGGIVGWAVTIVLVWISWVFFRAETLAHAIEVIGGMFRFADLNVPIPASVFAFLLLGIFFEGALRACPKQWPNLSRLDPWWKPAVLAGLITICIFMRGAGQTFIYFNF
ncbi:MAG: MBOAT family protein [Opitutae bacterium]|nr:MBOAT family protein [Opitutae bacterium]